jgi:hypothetical protein
MVETETETPGPGGGRKWKARAILLLGSVAVAVYSFLNLGDGAAFPPIRQRGAWIVVENQTPSPWKNVSVTINAYYRGVSPELGAGGRLEAPLSGFTTGLGQRFNTMKEHIRRVEVRATDASGNPVTLDWDETKDPPLVREGQ